MTVLEAEGISKQYRLGLVGTGTISHDLNRWWHKVRGKSDPYLKVGEANDRSVKGDSQYVWSLKDVNFEVKQGEVLGIIGKNGAGKSTLLKILSQVTSPTTGEIRVKGRVASLLEVGTGFHPELTGRENIFLNGAILGMTKREIRSKFDEIVEFSGVERYIDTPVKRYSSGMMVRLGFAVAAHLEPEILVVDEVLAVGDAEFQKKCLGKMKDVSMQGRTILFVSHNMAAVKSLCSKAILLEKGKKIFDGPTDAVIMRYLNGEMNSGTYRTFESGLVSASMTLKSVGIHGQGKDYSEPIVMNEPIEFCVGYALKKDDCRYDFTLKIKGDDGQYFMVTSTAFHGEQLLREGNHELTMHIPAHFFNDGSFAIDLLVVENKERAIIYEKDILLFSVSPAMRDSGAWLGREAGYIMPIFNWK